MTGSAPDLEGLTVVVAGASSAAGVAVSEAMTTAGARVVAVGSHAGRLDSSLGHLGVELRTCDLTDFDAVSGLAVSLREDGIRVDGLFHLVGGWRGGSGIADQSEEDYEFLHRAVLTTLRNTTRAFIGDLEASPRGRLAIVSATAVDSPIAGSASYAAVKSSAETWVRAVAQQFAGQQEGSQERAAATVVVVKALLDEEMQAARPDRKFPGYTHVRDLAAALAALFDEEAAVINGQRISLAH